MKAAAILAAAGRGERLGADLPKALVEVDGRSLIAHAVATVEATEAVEGCVIAAPHAHVAEMERAAAGAAKVLAVVPGGASRQDSIRVALAAVPSGFDAIVCHDVARPFAGPTLFAAVLRGLETADGAVPVVPVPDTVKRLHHRQVVASVPREGLAFAQTPQAFWREALERAHRSAVEDGVEGTDDAALLERIGLRVIAVTGDPRNLKVTTVVDLDLAAALSAAPDG